MRSLVVKRSIAIGGRETSVSLEDAFWNRLKEIARYRQMTVSDLIATVDALRQHRNLSSALRIFVLDFYCSHRDEVEQSDAALVPQMPSQSADDRGARR